MKLTNHARPLKSFAKRLLRLLGTLCISPLLCTHFVLSRLAHPDASLEAHSQLLSSLPGLTGSYLRVAFYRVALEDCDPTVTIGFGTLFSKVGARLGPHVYIGPRCMLGLVTLEEDVLLGPAVQIPSGPMIHGIESLEVPIRDQTGRPRRITVSRDSWIGAGSIVLADVAEQTVVGAGSIVTKAHPSRTILAGVPAKVLKHRETKPVASRA